MARRTQRNTIGRSNKKVEHGPADSDAQGQGGAEMDVQSSVSASSSSSGGSGGGALTARARFTGFRLLEARGSSCGGQSIGGRVHSQTSACCGA